MEKRSAVVDHSSIRWAIRFLPLLEKVFCKHKRPVGSSWRMDETYIKVKGAWMWRSSYFVHINRLLFCRFTLESVG